MGATCSEDVFDPRRYDGTGVSVEHADGLIGELGRLCDAVRTGWAQSPVESKSVTDPPEDPEDAERYLVASGATGDWEGYDDYLAEWDDGRWIWRVVAPRAGMLTYVVDEDAYYFYDGDSWEPLQEAHFHPNLPTADEKAALAGSAGDPSDTNRYITEDDPRLAGLAGSGPQMVPLYVVIPDVGLDIFPTVHAVASDGVATNSSNWMIMHKVDYELSASVTARSIGVLLKWTASVTAGIGQLKWMISDGTEAVGSQPSGSAVDVLKTPKVVTTTETEDKVAGQAPAASLPTGDFSLLLVGKPNSAGQTVQAKILSDSQIELGY